MFLGKILAPSKPDAEKLSPYECGFEAFEDARMKFDVRYYLIAILFILFDLETAFLFPWGVALRDIGWFGYASMVIFLLEFIVGFVYIWKRALSTGSDRYGIRRRSQRRICYHYCGPVN
jgi:NADH-quinone oxidoreductase subunit A